MCIKFKKERPPVIDCVDINFSGTPIYSYYSKVFDENNNSPFTFCDNKLSLPFNLKKFGISDQSRISYSSLFILPNNVIISRGLKNFLIPGFNFKTIESIKKVLLIGSQIVCITKHIIYFLPKYFQITEFIDVDGTSELYVLKHKKVEIYSDKKEVFEVDEALKIRCTKNPRVVILATKYDVFLINLIKKTSKHLLNFREKITDIIYDNTLFENTDIGSKSTCKSNKKESENQTKSFDSNILEEVETNINDTKILLEALKTEKKVDGPEILYITHGPRVTHLCISSLQSRTLAVKKKFKIKVSRDYVILFRLKTFIFLSKDLRKFNGDQLEFRGIDSNKEVIGFFNDNLVIINKKKYTFNVSNDWQYSSNLFRMFGYYKLQEMYSKQDYEDDWSKKNKKLIDEFMQEVQLDQDIPNQDRDDCLEYKKEYICKILKEMCRYKKRNKNLWKINQTKLRRFIFELEKDLRCLENKYDTQMLKYELSNLNGLSEEKKAKQEAEEVPKVSEILNTIRKDYIDIYKKITKDIKLGKKKVVKNRYGSMGRRKAGF